MSILAAEARSRLFTAKVVGQKAMQKGTQLGRLSAAEFQLRKGRPLNCVQMLEQAPRAGSEVGLQRIWSEAERVQKFNFESESQERGG